MNLNLLSAFVLVLLSVQRVHSGTKKELWELWSSAKVSQQACVVKYCLGNTWDNAPGLFSYPLCDDLMASLGFESEEQFNAVFKYEDVEYAGLINVTGWGQDMPAFVPSSYVRRFKEISTRNSATGTRYQCFSGSQYSADCDEKCLNKTNDDYCDGDDSFLNLFQNSTEELNTACYCKAFDVENVTELFVPKDVRKNLWPNYIWTRLLSESPFCTRRAPHNWDLIGFIEPLKRNYMERSVANDPEVFINLKDTTVTITCMKYDKVVVILRKESWVQMIEMNFSSISVNLPADVTLKSGPLFATVYFEARTIGEFEIAIVGKSLCRLDDCIMCWDAMGNFKCLPRTQQIFLIIMIIMFLVMIVAMFPAFIYALVLLMKCVLIPIWTLIKTLWNMRKSKMVKRMAQTTRDKVKSVKEYALTPDTEEEDQKNMEMSDIERIKQKYGTTNTRKNTMLAIAIILLFPLVLGQPAGSCTSGVLIPVTMTSCIESETYTVCNTSFSLTGTLPYLGSASCFTLTDTDGQVLGVFSVKFLDVVQTVSLSELYYTSAWTPYSQSVRRCDGSGKCTTNRCELTEDGDSRTAYGELDFTKVINYPGRTTCQSDCGCAGCGCFYCKSSCIFSGYGLVPTDYNYLVYAPDQVSTNPSVLLSFTDSRNNTSNWTISYSNGDFLGLPDDLDFQIVGEFNLPLTSFDGKKITSDLQTPSYSLVSAADQNVPVAGGIGDIQAASLEELSGSNIDFLFAEPLYTEEVTNGAAHYLFEQAGIVSTLPLYPKFPLVLDGNYWQVEENFLTSSLTSASALEFNMNTVGTFSVTKYVDVICPVIVGMLNASGCYSCDQGFSLNISAYSTCKAGFASVNWTSDSVSVFNLAVSLSTSASSIVLQGKTSVQDNDFSLCFNANGGSSCVEVEFVAVESVVIRNNTDQNTTEENSSGGSTASSRWKSWWKDAGKVISGGIGKFFDGIFNGSASWWEYLIFIFFAIVVLVVLFNIVVPMIRSLSPHERVRSAYRRVSRKNSKEL